MTNSNKEILEAVEKNGKAIKEILEAIEGNRKAIEGLDNKLSSFIKFYLMSWMNMQGRQVELHKAQDELKKAVGL